MPQLRTIDAQSRTEPLPAARPNRDAGRRNRAELDILSQEYAVLRSFLLFSSCLPL
jgi:hypothetical protein